MGTANHHPGLDPGAVKLTVKTFLIILELREAEQTNQYVRKWNQVNDEGKSYIDKHASTGYLRSAQRRETQYAWSTARRVQKCQAGTLATGKIRYRYRRQHTPFCIPCRSKERGDHRHDSAVELIAKAITRGYRGSVKVLRDTGKEVDKQLRERQMLPHYLFKDEILDRRKLKRPDIVVIPRLTEAAVIPDTFQPRRGKENMQ
eukprot:3384385-Pyramimonas_sp.AAC.1